MRPGRSRLAIRPRIVAPAGTIWLPLTTSGSTRVAANSCPWMFNAVESVWESLQLRTVPGGTLRVAANPAQALKRTREMTSAARLTMSSPPEPFSWPDSGALSSWFSRTRERRNHEFNPAHSARRGRFRYGSLQTSNLPRRLTAWPLRPRGHPGKVLRCTNISGDDALVHFVHHKFAEGVRASRSEKDRFVNRSMVLPDPDVVNQQVHGKALMLLVGLLQIQADARQVDGLVANQGEFVIIALAEFSQRVNLIVVSRNQRPELGALHAKFIDQVVHVLLGLIQVCLSIRDVRTQC